jgi:hypothetical protein
VLWEDTALNLLLARDRYTSQSIRDEFRSNPHRKAEPFDPKQNGFVTPVANNRFSVVWYEAKLGDETIAVVRAVVPVLDMKKSTAPKAYVGKVVEHESKGEIILS